MILEEVLKFIASPKASATATPSLIKAFSTFDTNVTSTRFYLEDLEDGMFFEFKERRFRKIRRKRTRVLCQALDNGCNYLISSLAEIKEL